VSRADLRIAVGEYALAETRLHLAVLRQYPELDLQPGYYWDHGIAKFPFDVTFEVPFNGNRGEIAEARTGRELAGQRMLAVQVGIYTEIAAAERAERTLRASEDVAQRQLEAAHKQEQQATAAFRLGAMDSLEMTSAQIFSLRAEIELVGVRAQLQAARNALEDVLHAPLSGPELNLTQAMSADRGASRS
jgi:outer membrane protein, heavy metal efflux system